MSSMKMKVTSFPFDIEVFSFKILLKQIYPTIAQPEH